MEMQQFLSMSGGEDGDSYAKNSSGQKFFIMKSIDLLEKCIEEFCSSIKAAECLKVADLGCSCGPNTILMMRMVMKMMGNSWQKLNKQNLFPVQIFLNDLFLNDFNTVFKSLPSFYEEVKGNSGSSCFVAAMPGSFYSRLFPDNSIHFMYSMNSLHWLSQVPNGLTSETSMALNKGNIYISNTSPSFVHDAYLDQFHSDFRNFLRLRSMEMVGHGQLFLLLHCHDEHEQEFYSYKDILAITLHGMVMEGLVEENTFDTFNLPIYEPSLEEARDIIEKEGSFKIMHLEDIEIQWDINSFMGLGMKVKSIGEFMAANLRAVFESVIANHFGDSILDDLYSRYAEIFLKYMEKIPRSNKILVISLAKI